MKNTWSPLIFLMGVLLAASCAPAPTEAGMTATQEALASPASTDSTAPASMPTTAPVIAQTPAVTPVPFEVEAQENGGTLVRVPAYGFQFVLPVGWSYGPPGIDDNPGTFGSAEFMNAGGLTVGLRLHIVDTNLSMEALLEERVEYFINSLASTIHRQGVAMNRNSVSIAYLEVSGQNHTEYYHLYSLYFISNGEMIAFFFFGSDITFVIPAIEEIQASIQWIY